MLQCLALFEELGPNVAPDILAPAIVKAAEAARIGVLVTSGSGAGRRHALVSSYIAELVGRDMTELEGIAPSEVFAPEQREALEAWRDRRLARLSSPSAVEAELLRADAGRVPVRISSSSVHTGDESVLVEYVVDTRERRKTELALSRSEERFRELIEAAPEAVAIGLSEGLAYLNPAGRRLLGLDATDLHEMPLDEHVHPSDRPRAARHVRELLQTGATTSPISLRLRHRDGKYVDVEIVALLVEWDGKPAALAIGRDLGERRQLHTQLVQADRLAAIGTLAAGIAHEINNPLAYVLLNLEYLIRELARPERDPERIPRLIERLGEARHGAERVSSIVGDLRAFAREERDETGPVDLRLVLTAAAKVAEGEVRSRGRLIEQYEDVPPVRGNAARLEQVFLNLLVNAAQALPPNVGNGEVRVSLTTLGARVIVEISDSGAGIPTELLDRVFDPFFSTKPVGIGTGLGLPICHRIVTSLGGEISVQSELGRGTVFRVGLPAIQVSRRSVTPTPGPTPAAGPRARVLIVDDELPVASMLSRVLGDQHDVVIATSGREALEHVLAQEFDVVLCDLLMPGMSGMDLFRELASCRPGAEKRLVFMTGGAFTPRAAEFLASVDNVRLEKPFDLARIRRMVRQLAAERAASR